MTGRREESPIPLYEYECDKGHRFERIQKHGARAPRCPECDSRSHRQLSAPAIQFKGEGWYVTDYARKGKKDDGKSGSSDDKSDSAKKDGAKAEGGKKDSTSKVETTAKGDGSKKKKD